MGTIYKSGIPYSSGGGKGEDKFFEYKQLAPSTIWEISHTLNKYPSVTVVDSGGNIVVGDIQYVNNTKITITFTGAFSGVAYLN